MVLRLFPLFVAAFVATGVATAALRAGEPHGSRLSYTRSAPLFDVRNLVPGKRHTACAVVRNNGDRPVRSALRSAGLTGDLARHLRLSVASASSCADAGGSVLFTGPLASFPSTDAASLLDPSMTPAGGVRSYRLTLTLGDDPAAEGRASTWAWQLLGGTASEASSRATCSRVQIAGHARGATRRTVSWRRGELRLTASVAGTSGSRTITFVVRARHPRLTLGGRRLRGRRPTRPRTLEAHISASSLRPGRTRVLARGGGRVMRVVLRVTATALADRNVCVVTR